MYVRITAPNDGTGNTALDIPEQINTPADLLAFIHEYLALYGVTYRIVVQPHASKLKARIVTDYEIPMEFEVKS